MNNRKQNKSVVYETSKEWLKARQDLLNWVASQPKVHSIVSGLGIKPEHSGKFAFIPDNLDLEAHLRNYPVTNYYFVEDCDGHIKTVNTNGTFGAVFDEERLIYLIGLIYSIPGRNKDSISEDGFVSINSAILRDFFKDYLSYLDYLLRTGIFITDSQYIVGKKSIGYKLSDTYCNSPLRTYIYIHSRENQSHSAVIEAGNNYLLSWYNNNLQINASIALEYAERKYREKIAGGVDTWDYNRDTHQRKNPKLQYYAIHYNIESIIQEDYKVKIDDIVHRLHSVLTNMQKDYRNFIKYDGKDLVSIDISNSQPYLLCLLLNPLFWDKSSALAVNIGKLPANVQNLFSEEDLSSLQAYVYRIRHDIKVNEYIYNASEGHIYEYMLERARENGEEYQRKDMKIMILMTFFSDNKFLNQPNAKLKKLFKLSFPKIYGLIHAIKKGRDGKKKLAVLLQSIESTIVLQICCKKIWEENAHQVPIFTIHDSICTTLEYENLVFNVMTTTLNDIVQVTPNLKKEYWTPRNLSL